MVGLVNHSIDLRWAVPSHAVDVLTYWQRMRYRRNGDRRIVELDDWVRLGFGACHVT